MTGVFQNVVLKYFYTFCLNRDSCPHFPLCCRLVLHYAADH
jgi:hypothetical protein